MKYRPLGRSGVTVSEIGFGAWGIGGATPGATSYGSTDDATSCWALRRAYDEGVTFYDTSSVYGYGHSERLVGRVFKDLRDRVTIATKAGLLEYGRPPDFTPAGLRRSLEGSLTRLGTDYVDLLQLHNPPRRVIEQSDEIRKLVDEFKRSGKIRAFGVSLRLPEDGLLAIEHMEPDALQTNLNLLDHRAIDCGLLDLSARRGTSLIARTPLCFGFLSGGYDAEMRFDDRDHRSRWSRGQVAGWVEGAKQVLCCMADPSIQTASQFALRFCLSFPEVATAIPGMLREEEVLENVKASGLGPLAPAEMAEVERAYRGNKCFTEHEGFTFDRPADPGKIDVA